MKYQTKTVGDLCDNISRSYDFSNINEVVFINTGDVFNGKFLHKKFSKVNKLPGQAKKAIQKDDILYSEIRPKNKRFAYVKDEHTKFVVSTKFMVLKAKKNISTRYLYHYLTSEFSLKTFQVEAESRSGTFPQITFDSISYLPVNIPLLKDQNEITNFFDLIENKLEVLEKINNNLDNYLSALFKFKFIDFGSDSLKKNIKNKTFSKNFISGSLGDLIFRSKIKIDKLDTKVLAATNNGELVLSEEYFSKKVYSKDIKKYLKVEKHEFSYNPSRINIGSVGMNKYDFVGAVSPVYIVFKTKKNWHWFVEEFLKIKSTKLKIEQLSSGSVRQSLSFEDLSSISLKVPDESMIMEFNQTYEIIRKKIIKNKKEIKILRTIKNTIFSKIILGESIFSNNPNLINNKVL